MAETKQIVTLTILTLIIGIIGVSIVNYVPSLFEGDVVVDEYTAKLYPNGLLLEDYTYNVKTAYHYRMLYRSWQAPLSMEKLNTPHIQFLNASSSEKLIFYSKDYKSSTWLADPYEKDSAALSTVQNLAERNEAGAFNPDRFKPGKHKISYAFQIRPPMEYDENRCHLNIKLASTHLTYRNVTIIIKDSSYVEAVYPHPPLMQVNRRDSEIMIRGSSAKDELLEVELLLNKDALKVLEGFPTKHDDVKASTIQA
ncbi:DUF2207 domain-containing protein, partial [Candidatus Bathyarchaeota archaeon]|nr:DUF2207 domain-containing protein [Candidatus Bathyarchaeota archaeon]